MTQCDPQVVFLLEQFEEHLKQVIPSSNQLHASLFDAARYSLLNGGKRIRPLLALVTVDMFKGNLKNAFLPCCALEMIHTYSLIHDDLPCMDDDDFRRGKPSLHKAFPEAHAVLTGDYLLTYAFELLSTCTFLNAEIRLSLIQTLSHHAGSEGMIGGQILDIESEGKKLELDQLQHIHKKKTGALITASIEFGCILANQPTHLLSQFGADIGLAFQIIDDVLDASETQDEEKASFVSLVGVEKSKNMAYTLYQQATERLKALPYDSSVLQALSSQLIYRNK